MSFYKLELSMKSREDRIMVKLMVFIIVSVISYAQEFTSGDITRQKNEIAQLKKEFNEFYSKKESEYKKQKEDLLKLKKSIDVEKKEIETLYKKNQDLFERLTKASKTKTVKIYNKMKPKIIAKIFNQMIDDGKIDDVFDIILGLKENKVTQFMKFINVESAATLTKMLKDYYKGR
jgi:flagellar motility protein MotE (MotC chaperone)